MTRIYALLIIAFCACTMIGCLKNKNGKHYSLDAENLKVAKGIIRCLSKDDEVGLFNLFCDEVKNTKLSLGDDIRKLFDTYDGEIVKYEKYAIMMNKKMRDNGLLIEYYSRFRVLVDNTWYMLHYVFIAKNSSDLELEGVKTIKFIKEVDEDKYFQYWTDMEDGIVLY